MRDSLFIKHRRKYLPRPGALLANLTECVYTAKAESGATVNADVRSSFPATFASPPMQLVKGKDNVKHSSKRAVNVGVVLSGGPAPGGHNVICGLFQGLQAQGTPRRLIGFLQGPSGLLENQWRSIDQSLVDQYINTGGFDLLGSGRTKIATVQQMERCAQVLREHDIGALVIIGGDDSNTNAAHLAEYFAAESHPIQVIGVPKTIDGDLRCDGVQTSFGFDTAARVYAELVSNIAKDTLSAKKYYHFVRLMGRAASHITLEVALLTQVNYAIIGEDVAARKLRLDDIVEDLCRVVMERAKQGKHYGMILVPEGVIEFVEEMRSLLCELNNILAHHREHMLTLRGFTEQSEFLHHKLGKDESYTFSSLPIEIQRQLLMDRDPHGNVIVSHIETERLIISLMQQRLAELKSEGVYAGGFAVQRHFLGYEGRCAAPTNFDADYAYALGLNAVALIDSGCTAYLSGIANLSRPREEWQPHGVPLASLMVFEERHGMKKPVIKRALVDLDSGAFRYFQDHRDLWAMNDDYSFVGPIQYFGPSEICDWVPRSIMLDSAGRE